VHAVEDEEGMRDGGAFVRGHCGSRPADRSARTNGRR
jgi:hypothetical protein